MSGYQPGEIVDVTIRGARVDQYEVLSDLGTNENDEPREYLTVKCGEAGDEITLVVNTRGITVERVAPAEWPPQPGDVWKAKPSDVWGGGIYFARDLSNLDNEPAGSVIRLVGASEYCDGTYDPADLARRHQLTLDYRPEPANSPPTPAAPRTWPSGVIPADVTAVRDVEDDVWRRQGDMWVCEPVSGPLMARDEQSMLGSFGPVAEIVGGSDD